MKIVINESNDNDEIEIVINCNTVDSQVTKIIASLNTYDKRFTGIQDGCSFILKTNEVFYIDTVDRKTFLYAENEVYESPLKLYELEKRFENEGFVRASKSTIINFNRIRAIKSDFGGKLLIIMENDENLNVSRQYASIFKAKLGLLNRGNEDE